MMAVQENMMGVLMRNIPAGAFKELEKFTRWTRNQPKTWPKIHCTADVVLGCADRQEQLQTFYCPFQAIATFQKRGGDGSVLFLSLNSFYFLAFR